VINYSSERLTKYFYGRLNRTVFLIYFKNIRIYSSLSKGNQAFDKKLDYLVKDYNTDIRLLVAGFSNVSAKNFHVLMAISPLNYNVLYNNNKIYFSTSEACFVYGPLPGSTHKTHSYFEYTPLEIESKREMSSDKNSFEFKNFLDRCYNFYLSDLVIIDVYDKNECGYYKLRSGEFLFSQTRNRITILKVPMESFFSMEYLEKLSSSCKSNKNITIILHFSEMS
jgi:hypothetical protein